MAEALSNWGGNLTYSARQFLAPRSREELQRMVAASGRVHVLGTRHSFSAVADTSGELITLGELPAVLDIDSAAAQVQVNAGCRYGELALALAPAGLALGNLGSLPHISIGGAASTGTHGSGDHNRVLADAVAALEMVTADGEVVRLDRSTPDFAGSVLALGSLGAVVTMTLDLVPSFELRQYVYDDLPMRALVEQFDQIMSAAYSVSVFTQWRHPHAQVWLKSGSPRSEGDWLGAHLADVPRHPIPTESGSVATQQLGVPGPSYERLPHFRLEFTPSRGDEIQSEYLIARTDAPAAIEALVGIGDRLAGPLLISEIRTVAADELWLSCAYERDSVALHFTWALDEPAVRAATELVEAVLAPFSARPHWGKVFSRPRPDLFARLGDFLELRDRLDPTGKFGNDFLLRYLAG